MTSIDPKLARKRRRHRNERIVAAILVLLAGGAAGWGIWWNRAEQRDLRRDLRYIPKGVTITPEVEQLRAFVRIDSSKPEGIAAGARWLAEQLAQNGIRAELIESGPNMISVYARIPGRRPGGGLLLFNHIDVVPPGEGWKAPPFAAVIVGDQLWGRGTLDMKALTICQLVAFVDVARSGRKPEHDLVFLATPDEETGSRHGMQWLLEHRPDVFVNVEYGITEGGTTEMMTDRMTHFGIEIGGKQVVQVALTGPSEEVLKKTRIGLEPFMFTRQPQRLLPAVRRYFKEIAPTRTSFRPLLADIDATIRDGQFWRLPVTYRDFLQNTVYAGAPMRTDRGWQMIITLINLPDETPENRVAWLEKTITPFGAHVREVVMSEGTTPLSSEQTPLFAWIAEEAENRYQVDAGMLLQYRSTSDCRFLRRRDITCYGLSPYPVNFYQSLTIHRKDENISVWAFQEGVELLRAVVERWARTA